VYTSDTPPAVEEVYEDILWAPQTWRVYPRESPNNLRWFITNRTWFIWYIPHWILMRRYTTSRHHSNIVYSSKHPYVQFRLNQQNVWNFPAPIRLQDCQSSYILVGRFLMV